MRRLLLPVLAIAACLACDSVAWAEGGKSIAGGTPVVVGQQEFGNTANGAATGYDCTDYSSYWSLNAAAGDQVIIDWSSARPTELLTYPVGTTDYSLGQTSPDQEQSPNENGHAELTFTASVTGAIPLRFRDGCDGPGPYDFVATLRHAVVLSLPKRSSLPLTGGMFVGVHSSSGAPISDAGLNVSLQVAPAGKPYVTIGSSHPSNGVAGMGYTVPTDLANRHLALRAIASGGAYQPATSAKETVRSAQALRLRLQRFSSVGRRSRIRVAVKRYDGLVFTDPEERVRVQVLSSYGAWKTVGSSTVGQGFARMRLNLPRHTRHHHVRLRVRASGTYPTQITGGRRVRVR